MTVIASSGPRVVGIIPIPISGAAIFFMIRIHSNSRLGSLRRLVPLTPDGREIAYAFP